MRRTRPALLALLLVATPLWAEKPSRELRDAFEETFRRGKPHAVVLLDGIPAVSIHGEDEYGFDDDRDRNRSGTYSIDVRDGAWKVSRDFDNADQDPVSELTRGEVMKLASIGWRNDRIELRMVSVREHSFQRGALIKTTVSEPVSTNFKFFLPEFAERQLAADDLPLVSQTIERVLKFFPDEAQARAFAAGMPAEAAEPPLLVGSKGAEGASLAPEARKQPVVRKTPETRKEPVVRKTEDGSAPRSRQEIRGMTPLQVLDALGRPLQESVHGDALIWKYPQFEVVFEHGMVTAVRI